MPARRRRRSNVVGSPSPTSTPRRPSGHRTTSGKRECPSIAAPCMRRRPSDRDLREAVTERAAPSAQRRPRARRLSRDLPRADSPSDLPHRLTDEEPQRERHRDGRVPVVLARRHAARHHRQHDAARGAAIAPTRNDQRRRGPGRRDRATQLTLPNTVTMQPETHPGCTARGAAGTPARPRRLDRRRRLQPALDVACVMNDSWSASGRTRQWWPARSTTSTER